MGEMFDNDNARGLAVAVQTLELLLRNCGIGDEERDAALRLAVQLVTNADNGNPDAAAAIRSSLADFQLRLAEAHPTAH